LNLLLSMHTLGGFSPQTKNLAAYDDRDRPTLSLDRPIHLFQFSYRFLNNVVNFLTSKYYFSIFSDYFAETGINLLQNQNACFGPTPRYFELSSLQTCFKANNQGSESFERERDIKRQASSEAKREYTTITQDKPQHPPRRPMSIQHSTAKIKEIVFACHDVDLPLLLPTTCGPGDCSL
jgi:hypothetical protein